MFLYKLHILESLTNSLENWLESVIPCPQMDLAIQMVPLDINSLKKNKSCGQVIEETYSYLLDWAGNESHAILEIIIGLSQMALHQKGNSKIPSTFGKKTFSQFFF